MLLTTRITNPTKPSTQASFFTSNWGKSWWIKVSTRVRLVRVNPASAIIKKAMMVVIRFKSVCSKAQTRGRVIVR